MYAYDDIAEMSLTAIRRLNDAGIPCVVLTKGLLPHDLTEQPKVNSYGITLISLDERYRMEAEPGAAPLAERIGALKGLHEDGNATWVSMEPYLTPSVIDQDILEVLESVSFVDRIVFGRTCYNRFVSSFPNAKAWYADQARTVMAWCAQRGIDCHIKKDTLPKDESTHKNVSVLAGA